jgi:hypothetical protein
MKNTFFLSFLVFISVVIISCNQTTEPEPQPGRRDYVWRIDTLQMPVNFLGSVWGATPNDVWAVGAGDPVRRNWQTINNALNGIPANGGIKVYPGTYTENINMQPSVKILGAGTSSSTINGTVTFNSADYSSLKNAAVNGKISVNNSSSVVIENVKANNSNCYIDAYGSSVTAITLFVGSTFFSTNYIGV